jgi:hypothetical protein
VILWRLRGDLQRHVDFGGNQIANVVVDRYAQRNLRMASGEFEQKRRQVQLATRPS